MTLFFGLHREMFTGIVETGRFNLPPANRSMQLFSCKKKIEDELHFLYDCDSYQYL